MSINSAIRIKQNSGLSLREAEGLTFLEQLTAHSSVSCSNPRVPFFYRYDETRKIAEFARGSCKQWDCPSCGARNAKRWIARIIDGCNKLDSEWYFCTITAHKKWRGGEASLKNIRANWHKVRKRYARIAKKEHKKFHYARVWEAHRDGSFHLHFITNIHRTKKQLKDMSAECGLGFMAHTDRVKNAGQVAGYVAKYMLKSMPNATNYPKGARRIEVSENWVNWKEKETEWQVVLDVFGAEIVANSLRKQGYIVHDLAIRNEMKRIDKGIKENVERNNTIYENRRTNTVDCNGNAHGAAGKRIARPSRQTSSLEGQPSGKTKESGKKPKAKANYSHIFKRVDKPTDDTKGVLMQ